LNETPNTAPGPASPIITLTTDFGPGDYFVGSVKGVLLREAILAGAPETRLVDITHHI